MTTGLKDRTFGRKFLWAMRVGGVTLGLLAILATACSIPQIKTRAKSGDGSAMPLGELDSKIVNEASGLVVSRLVNDRLYHVNDSGDGPYLYQTTFSGDFLRKITIKNFDPRDAEDLAYGPCGGKTCLVIADVGDNPRRRESVELVFVEETANLPDVVTPLGSVFVKYPDGAHNMEGVALHPNGDLFFLSKEIDEKKFKTTAAQVYRVKKAVWEGVVFGAAGKEMGTRKAPVVAEAFGKIDFPTLLKDSGYMGQGVTALDISPDGQKFLVLTYMDAIEFSFDLSKGPFPGVEKMVSPRDYRRIPLTILDQQEALAYLPDGSGFIYTTEMEELSEFRRIPIMQVDLPRPSP